MLASQARLASCVASFRRSAIAKSWALPTGLPQFQSGSDQDARRRVTRASLQAIPDGRSIKSASTGRKRRNPSITCSVALSGTVHVLLTPACLCCVPFFTSESSFHSVSLLYLDIISERKETQVSIRESKSILVYYVRFSFSIEKIPFAEKMWEKARKRAE